MSRRRHQPSPEQRRQVMTMAGFGIPQLEIANLVGISDRTLRTRYRRELDTGATEANLRVAQSLYNMAVRDKVPAAAIWWTKARMGWRGAGDPAGDTPLQVEFSWRDSEPAVAPAPKPAPPTIEAEPEADSASGGELTVTWAGED